MDVNAICETAEKMVANGRGILAMDESTGTCNKRFEKLGIDTTEESRRQYRELLLTAPNLSDYVAGAILYDETIRQKTSDGTPFPEYMKKVGMIPGIKVDTGAKPLALHDSEKVTEGLDGLRERFSEYYELGARFSKWRAVITIGKNMPSDACIQANAHALARYAALAQEANIAPIVEPEVLIDGDHSIQTCYDVTERTLNAVFAALAEQGVVLEGMVLKPSMVISALDAPNRAGVQEVAEQTLKCLSRTVPSAVPGIAFLSGGQGIEESSAHLNAMNQLDMRRPWWVTFSYARALQGPAMETWKGDPAKVKEAQEQLLKRAKFNSLAAKGEYSDDMETQAA